MSSDATHFCERCSRRVLALRAPWFWRVASVAGLFFFLLLTVAAGASGSLLLGGGIVVMILGTLVLGPLNELASEPARCPSCHCVVFPIHSERAARALEARAQEAAGTAVSDSSHA
jgi:hypothetical protein